MSFPTNNISRVRPRPDSIDTTNPRETRTQKTSRSLSDLPKDTFLDHLSHFLNVSEYIELSLASRAIRDLTETTVGRTTGAAATFTEITKKTITINELTRYQAMRIARDLRGPENFNINCLDLEFEEDPEINQKLTDIVRDFPNIRGIINFSAANDESLRIVAGLAHIETLSLTDGDDITDAGLTDLAQRARNLKHLTIRGSFWLSGLEILTRLLPNLRHLDLSEWAIPDAGIERLTRFKKLTHFTSQDFNIEGSLSPLAALPELSHLDFYNASMSIEIIQSLNGLQITDLNIGLNLEDDSRIARTDAHIAVLTNLPNLRNLNLSGITDITDQTLTHLVANFRSLTSLNLSQCHGITDQGILSLAGLPNLEHLNLNKCDRITTEGTQALLRLRPQLTILAEAPSSDVEIDEPELEGDELDFLV